MESDKSSSPELMSLSNQNKHLGVPNIKRIWNMHEFMTEMQVKDAKQLNELLLGQEKQCLNIKNLLSNQVQNKLKALENVKEDMLDLRRQLRAPGASYRFTRGYTVLVKFTDETEMNEYEVPDALAQYSLKMSSLFGEILTLDSDVDYVGYLLSIIRINMEYAEDWFRRERLRKARESK